MDDLLVSSRQPFLRRLSEEDFHTVSSPEHFENDCVVDCQAKAGTDEKVQTSKEDFDLYRHADKKFGGGKSVRALGVDACGEICKRGLSINQ